nr:hypothetical protein EINA62G7_00034 [Candidatus Nanopelagicales bacterium]
MKKLTAAILALTLLGMTPATAHQPVELLDSDTTPSAGPLLVDGTVSFAVRASFTKTGQKKAFRAALKEGEQLDVQYLIVDKKPENKLKTSRLPLLVIASPSGKKTTMKFTERTPFYEPWGRTSYFYLGRLSEVAEDGVYSFMITARTKSAITLGVGAREVPGEVLRDQ